MIETEARPFCETCGKDVAEILCPVCAKWWHDNDPLYTQALAAGYVSVADWVAAKDAEIARLRGFIKSIDEAALGGKAARAMARAALGDPQ